MGIRMEQSSFGLSHRSDSRGKGLRGKFRREQIFRNQAVDPEKAPESAAEI
jgi:hypothetical protein